MVAAACVVLHRLQGVFGLIGFGVGDVQRKTDVLIIRSHTSMPLSIGIVTYGGVWGRI